MISSSFRKVETKNLNSDPRILIFLVLENWESHHQLYIGYLNIRNRDLRHGRVKHLQPALPPRFRVPPN